jgi:exodeoxyribonuclease V gamma subunit
VAVNAADADVELSLTDITELLRDRLAGRPTRASFRTGTLTVCTLVPMRSVPHRVVCLLGMDDGAFPRQSIADGDDVLAREPRTGERDVRTEDRQLFLDAICSAQEHLIISYTGTDPRTGADVPPCVPLSELLDAVDATAVTPDGSSGREHVVIKHPLQPFDPRNFLPGELGIPRSFSFDPSALAGAGAAVQPRTAPPPLVADRLPSAPTRETVGLDDLVRFFQQPVRGFLRQRLDISTAAEEEDPADALTVELEALSGWAVGDRVLQQCLAGTPRETAARLERLRGELPPGPLGTQAMRTIGRRVDALLHASELERAAPSESIDIAVPLSEGRALSGTVGGVRGSTILTVTYSTLAPKHRLTAWLRYLAVVAANHDAEYRAVTVGRNRDDARRSILHGAQPDIALQLLELLVRIRDAGLREPLPLVLETSAEYATRRSRGATIDDAISAACKRWEADRFRPERDEPEHVLVFGANAPFAQLNAAPPLNDERFPDERTRFGALARLVWQPLLMAETEVWP